MNWVIPGISAADETNSSGNMVASVGGESTILAPLSHNVFIYLLISGHLRYLNVHHPSFLAFNPSHDYFLND